jgi:hypothetical protein
VARVDLNAPPLVPLAVLALASSGQVGPAGAPSRDRAAPPAERRTSPATALGGRTAQGRPVSVRRRGDRAAWRIAYVARCDDGTIVRGRYVSGRGTPLLAIGPDGRFRLSRTEPAEFDPEGTGTARFAISGRLGARRGTGRWLLRLVTPPVEGRRVACSVGPLTWRVGTR